jgi:ketosteroid isomerase-like protein
MATLSARFSQALRALENEGDMQPIVQLFACDAEVFNPLMLQPESGLEAVRRFWRTYLDCFSQVKSEFLRFVDARDVSAVEWIVNGVFHDGRQVEYSGTTMIETQDEQITRMHAYFDPRALVESMRLEPTAMRRRSGVLETKTA